MLFTLIGIATTLFHFDSVLCKADTASRVFIHGEKSIFQSTITYCQHFQKVVLHPSLLDMYQFEYNQEPIQVYTNFLWGTMEWPKMFWVRAMVLLYTFMIYGLWVATFNSSVTKKPTISVTVPSEESLSEKESMDGTNQVEENQEENSKTPLSTPTDSEDDVPPVMKPLTSPAQ